MDEVPLPGLDAAPSPRVTVELIVLWCGADRTMVKEHDLAEPFYLPRAQAIANAPGCGRRRVSLPRDVARARGLVA